MKIHPSGWLGYGLNFWILILDKRKLHMLHNLEYIVKSQVKYLEAEAFCQPQQITHSFIPKPRLDSRANSHN